MIRSRQCVPQTSLSAPSPPCSYTTQDEFLNSMIGGRPVEGRKQLKWMLAQSGAFVIDSYEALYQEGTPIMTPCSEQEQEYYSDDQSDHFDNQGTEV
ncbi:unnamed protein product [Coregonus sp. 'balchen']|nr:unnamed protein product [Coregonus sp. 'balchen']